MKALKLVELEGQSFVLAKLSRLRFVSSLTPTNTPEVDIQAFHYDSKKQILVQVKSVEEPNDWQLYADKFLDIKEDQDSEGKFFMEARGRLPLSKQTIFWVFVKLSNDKCDKCHQNLDEMFVCTKRDVQDIADKKFRKALEPNSSTGKKQGYRANGGNSKHFTITPQDLQAFTNWGIIPN
jgi:hypothetical protein